jgi:hypothetical protein
MSKIYTSVVKECEDGSGDVYIELPDEMLADLGWKEGQTLDLDIKKDPTGNVIVLTAVA